MAQANHGLAGMNPESRHASGCRAKGSWLRMVKESRSPKLHCHHLSIMALSFRDCPFKDLGRALDSPGPSGNPSGGIRCQAAIPRSQHQSRSRTISQVTPEDRKDLNLQGFNLLRIDLLRWMQLYKSVIQLMSIDKERHSCLLNTRSKQNGFKNDTNLMPTG